MWYNKLDYICVGLADSDVEYRIGSVELYQTDLTLLTEVKKGDTIYLNVEDLIKEGNSAYNTDISKWSSIKTIKTDSKEYLTYEGYVKAFESNRLLGKIVGFTGCGVSILLVPSIFVINNLYKKKEDEECIDINA